ncbi:MAG TPA: protein kinase [Chthoniobacterales bacterium]|nr:protein kinase [Chthoniobacterales bacterium]
MKTFSPGLSDSIASVLADAPPCPHCDSSSHVAGGLCVGCLLQSGLDLDDECEPEALVSALAEINLPDQNWRLGNYEILEEIGRGGMGVIYRARQRHSRRIVAVKRVLSYHSDSRETLARFRREAQAAASLDHPNILPIYEVSESDDGLPFFSMKFAPGGNLQEVGRALRNDARQCVALVAKVARAVQYAHAKGILHRDLKPGNILLDARGEPLVSDFGLAKWLDTTSELTRSLTIFGTPGYIAPEQASGPAADLKPTADIYSLGAILFDLLAGRPPFLGAHALSVIRQAAESPAPKLRTLSKIADRDLETICSHCLERDPSARYPSAHDLAEDLERWLEGRSIIARPVSPPIKVWRWSRRNPKLAVSIAAVAVLASLGLSAALTSNRLSMIVRNAELAQRSVVMTAFEDLDEVSTDSAAARSVTAAFAAALKTTSRVELRETNFDANLTVDAWKTEDYKKLGERAAARMIVTGSVRTRGGKQRIAIHLVDAGTGTVVDKWLMDGDSSVARDVAAKIAAALTSSKNPAANNEAHPNESSKDPAARSYYARGKDFLFRHNLTDQYRAIESLREAVRIDPQYALAYAMLASACQLRSVTDPDGKWLDESESASAAALRLAPLLPDAYRAYAGHLRNKGHIRTSLDPYLTAYELDPSSGRAAAIVGYVHEVLGRPDLAVSWLDKATRRETQPVYADNLGDAWTALGEYKKAEEAFRIASVFRPDLPVGPLGIARLMVFRGEYEQARKACDDARQKYKDNPQPLVMAALIEFFGRDFPAAEKFYQEASVSDRAGGVNFPGSIRFLSAIGFIRQTTGINPDAGKTLLEQARALDEKELLATPDNPRHLYSLAATYAALGDGAAATVALEKAIAAGWIDHRSMTLDPRFDSLRSTRAFTDTLNRLISKLAHMKRTSQSGDWLTTSNQ